MAVPALPNRDDAFRQLAQRRASAARGRSGNFRAPRTTTPVAPEITPLSRTSAAPTASITPMQITNPQMGAITPASVIPAPSMPVALDPGALMPAPAAAPQTPPAAPARPLARTMADFNKMFSYSYFDPESKDPRPTRQQRDQSSILRDALGYSGRMTLNDLVNLPQAQIEAALEKARTAGPLKIDKGSPFANTKAGRKLKAQAAKLNRGK